jgi:FdhE protein
MIQRILEPGEIETLAERSIPRIRIPDRTQIFARRAARLRELAAQVAIGDYLKFIAAIADAQHAILQNINVVVPDEIQRSNATAHGMPPIHVTSWPLPTQWREVLEAICAHIATKNEFPPSIAAIITKIQNAPTEWIQAQADALLAARHEVIEPAVAPIFMAALQVCWVACSGSFVADKVHMLDVAGVCPLCGSLPVASIVCARSPYQGYRYLHCSLCATEWHMVRVQCSHCGAVGKSIGYHHLDSDLHDKNSLPAVRAESCDQCHGYRKIVYQEKDPQVDPLADDVATIALDLLLGEHGYHRVSDNPMLWHSGAT